MSLFSKLFGGGAAPEAEPEEHGGFLIYPEPIAEGGKYRLCARIEKTVDGELKSHRLIRADVLDDREAAHSVSLAKAKQVIEESGDRLFD